MLQAIRRAAYTSRSTISSLKNRKPIKRSRFSYFPSYQRSKASSMRELDKKFTKMNPQKTPRQQQENSALQIAANCGCYVH